MSLAVTTYYCTQCDFQSGDVRTWGTREYRLPNGVLLPVNKALGWCHDCADIAPIEDLSVEPWLDDLRRARNKVDESGERPPRGKWRLLRFVFPTRYHRIVEDWFSAQCSLDDALDGLELIRMQTRPPKCLTCGSERVHTPLVTNQEPWADDAEPRRTGFQHPECGGEIWMTDAGMRIGLRPTTNRYSPDGLLLETQEIGGYTLPPMEYFLNRDIQNARARGKDIPAVLVKGQKLPAPSSVRLNG